MNAPEPIFLYEPDGWIDYAGTRYAATQGTKARKAAPGDRSGRRTECNEGVRGHIKPSRRALPPRELAGEID
jgi:hypothetical protein